MNQSIVKRDKYRKALEVAIPILILCFLLFTMLYFFRDRVSRMLSLEMEDKLVEVTVQMKRSFEKEILGEWNELQLIASVVEKDADADITLKKILANHANDTTEKIGVITLEGDSIYGDFKDKRDLSLFLTSFRGNKQVLYLDQSGLFPRQCLLLSVPLYRGNHISGAVYKVISGERMENLFYVATFGGQGFTYCSASGFSTPIIPTKVDPQNAEIAVELMKNEKNRTALKSLNRKMFYKQNAVETFYHGESSYYIASAALEIMPGWYGMSVVGTEVVDEKVRFILLLSTACLFFLTMLFLFLYLVLKASEVKNAQNLHRLAYYDGLTGLLNFEGLKLYGQGSAKNAMVLLDMKGFRGINIAMGEAYGTSLLKKLGERIKSCLDDSKGELVCRVKDDVFVLWLTDSVEKPVELRRRLSMMMEECALCSDKMPLRFFCGVYSVPKGFPPSLSAFDCCVFIKKRIKNSGSENEIAFYDGAMQARENEDRLLENQFTKALENKEFLVYFQPKFYLKTGKLYGAEALVRWKHPEKGMISQGRFIPLFEENGRIHELDMYMFDGACALIRKWLDQGETVRPISVNLSRSHLNEPRLSENLAQVVARYRIPMEYIELELTESAFFENSAKLIDIMKNLKRQGFSISVDDFGTGYSSLSTLAEMPVDTIKLDKSFIDTWVKNPHSVSVIQGVLAIAHSMRIETLVEGIETERQNEMLTELGCSIGQGFYYSKPIEVAAYEKLMREMCV